MLLGLGSKPREGAGCYGKLPGFGDYVSYQCDGAEARRLTAWLDEGYRRTGGQDDPDAADTVFVLPARKKASLYGVLWPSADSSGTRRFPFALFAEARARALGEAGPLMTMGILDGLSAMKAAWASLSSCDNIERVGHLVADIALSPVPDPQGCQGLFDNLSSGARLTPATVGALFDVTRLTAHLSDGSKGKAPPFALRLPLTTDAPGEVEAAAWLTVLSQQFSMPRLATETAIFIRAGKGDGEGDLFLLHRELKVEDLGFVLSPSDAYPYANMLGVEVSEEEVAPFSAWLCSLVGTEATLSDLRGLDLSGFASRG
jgi:type VI secretion system ImpM family protein